MKNKTRIDLRGNDAIAHCVCGWWQTYCGDPKAKAARAGLIGHRRMKHGLRSHSKLPMFKALNVLALILFVAAVTHAQGVMPNPALTPGLFRPLSAAQVCSIKWGRDARHVTPKMGHEACAGYGLTPEQCDARQPDRQKIVNGKTVRVKGDPVYEKDHLGPRELAGADDKKNLWAQPWAEAKLKDRLENQLHKEVCALPPARREAALKEAQHEIVTDWWAAYRKRFPDLEGRPRGKKVPPPKKQPAKSPLADYRTEEARR